MDALYLYIPLIWLAILIIIDPLLHKQKNLPPRPSLFLPPLPIIGHLYLLKHPLHKSLAKLSAKYGPIQLLQFGSRQVLVISSPSAAEECLTKNDIVFANRPNLLAGKYIGYNYTSLVFAPYGDHWRNLRRVCTVEILSSHRLHEFDHIRSDEVRLMVRKLYRSILSSEKMEGVVEMRPVLFDLTHNAVMRMVSGKRYCSNDDQLTEKEKERARRFQSIVKELFEVMSTTNIGDFLPILRWIGVSKLEKQMIDLQRKRDVFMQDLVEEMKAGMKITGEYGEGKKKNFIQVLLSLQETEPEYYTDEMIRSIMLVILAGGTDTSISAMEWTFSLLLNNPTVLKKAQMEIDNCVGRSRQIAESDMPNLPYLRCIIKESMRMYPIGPLLPHASSEDCTVGGYHIPRGTMVLINVWGIHNDPTIWPDPEVFRPERFDGNEGNRIGFKLMPFGSGRRSCPGEGMATRMVGMGLGSLIQGFDWERTSEKEVDMSEGIGVSMPKAQRLEAKYRPRPVMLDLLMRI